MVSSGEIGDRGDLGSKKALVLRVGDQTGDWKGMKLALDYMFHSAWDNYLNFGCDIGGYRIDPNATNRTLGREKETFIRWFQLVIAVAVFNCLFCF